MRKTREASTGLTELESCVLGVVWLREPCSAYVVRRDFATSVSSYWTGSAGAIYPAIERLERLGMIGSVEHPWGKRTRKEYSITKVGRRTLRAWIGPPLDEWTSAPAFDPVRTRGTFISFLPPATRRKFVETAIGNLEKRLAQMRDRIPDREAVAMGDYFGYYGAMYELEGRLRWLHWVEKQLAEQS